MDDSSEQIMKEIKDIDSILNKIKEEQMQICKENNMSKQIGKEIYNLKIKIDKLLKEFRDNL